MGTQKNHLNKTVLLSTQNICSNWWISIYLQFYTQNFCLFKPMYIIWTICCSYEKLKMQKRVILNKYTKLKIKKLLSQQCSGIISTPVKRHLCSARLFQSSLCSKQCRSGLNCSPKSSLIQVHKVCLYGEISHWSKHKLHFPYITTHMSSTSSLLKYVFEAINIS